MTGTVDCVFVTVPFTDTTNPLMAPAVLKSIAVQAGKTAATLDLNRLFILSLEKLDQPILEQAIDFCKTEYCSDSQTLQVIWNLFFELSMKILTFKPSVVGLSVFSYDCRVACKYLAWMIKKIDPSVTIIIGGAGIQKHFAGRADFAENLKKTGVIDAYIYGDGEKALYHFLSTNDKKFLGINSHTWIQLTNTEIESLPPPDYTDYDFDLYPSPGLLILGSRGCVRQCTFCDVHVHWNKFTYRSGQNIFDEIMYFKKQFNINHFHFTDSLVNGNLREYRKLAQLLSDHNQNLPENEKITWNGFFILRSKSSFTEKDWQLTADSGARLLAVGIETTNDQIRKQLGKNFTNEDIEYAFQMAKKFGSLIKFVLLFFTGYPTETDEDYEFQVQWWREQVKYKDVIAAVQSGIPLGITDNTPLDRDFEKLGLIHTGSTSQDWANPANGNTPQKRIMWHQMIENVIDECGFPNRSGHDAHSILERMRNNL